MCIRDRYDTEVAYRIAEWAEEQYNIEVEDPEAVWGIGWWKYDPQKAEDLLLKNGFSKDQNGKWLLPDGTPWNISIIAPVSYTHLDVYKRQDLQGVELFLHDIDENGLEKIRKLAEKMNEAWGSGVKINSSVERGKALEGEMCIRDSF